jgi:acyl-CoA thioesterase FadM
MEYEIARVDSPNEPVARGSRVIVLVDYRTGAKIRVPDEFRAKVGALEKTAS